jgi:hypothetical protein
METEAQELNPKGEKKITKEKETEMKTIGYFSLFRYATAFEKFMLFMRYHLVYRTRRYDACVLPHFW